MTKKGKELIFISRIDRDGKGVELVGEEQDMSYQDEVEFELSCLSLSNKTFIASGFNCYVVKLKQ